jgi:hypothetical protein
MAFAAGPPPSDRLLAALVADLGNEDFEKRHEAANRLRDHVAAAQLLEDALGSNDAELRSSAAKLLDVIAPLRVNAACARSARLAREGRIDLLPDHLFRWARHDGKDVTLLALSGAAAKCWQKGLGRLAPAPRRRAEKAGNNIWIRGWTERSLWGKNYVRVVEDVVDSTELYNGFVVANLARLRGIAGILTSASKFEATSGVIGAIIVANGDVRIPVEASSCIIISDGTVELDVVSKSHVIARKGIRVRKDSGTYGGFSVFVSGGKAEVPPATKKTSHVEEDARHPLGLVRFFEPSDVGLTLDALSVKSIDPKCPLALAGLRKGDAFVSIDGKPTKDAEELRRALRRRFAIAGLGSFTVKRGGKTITLRARLAE